VAIEIEAGPVAEVPRPLRIPGTLGPRGLVSRGDQGKEPRLAARRWAPAFCMKSIGCRSDPKPVTAPALGSSEGLAAIHRQGHGTVKHCRLMR